MNTSVTYGIFLWLPKMLRETLRGRRVQPERHDGTSVHRRTGRDGARRATLGSDRRAQAARRRVRASRHRSACCSPRHSQHNIWLLVLSFTLSQMGQRSVMSVFWAIPPLFLGGTAAAAGIGLINAIGNLGGAAGPSMMGWLRDIDWRVRRRAARAGSGPDRRSDRRQPASPAASGARERTGAHRCLSGRHRGDTLPFRTIEQPRSSQVQACDFLQHRSSSSR